MGGNVLGNQMRKQQRDPIIKTPKKKEAPNLKFTKRTEEHK
jgi:hypothetical protein